MAKRLGLQGPDAFVQAARLINGFSYGGQMIKDRAVGACQARESKLGNHPCRVNPVPKGCDEHCEITEKGKSHPEFMREVLEFSVPIARAFEANSPKSLLPSCDWAEPGQCWSRVATDRGLCLKSRYPYYTLLFSPGITTANAIHCFLVKTIVFSWGMIDSTHFRE